MAKREFKEKITVRRGLDFGLGGDDIPRHWLAGDAFRTRVLDAVQASFPDGERYFIAAVRAFRERISDPVLAQEVKDFTMQEGQHGQVHSAYNERLRRQGIRVDAFTRHTREITDRRLQRLSPEYNLAMTAALEHFTAAMAELFFAEKGLLTGADERVRAMFAWHAIEEMEHKAVAFDVMQKVAGVGYPTRALAMAHASFSFTLYTVVSTWTMLGMDGFDRRQRLSLFRRGLPWLFGPRQGLFTRLAPTIARYFVPGFHPNQIPTVHNYGDWLERYAQGGDPIEAGEAMYRAAA